MLIVAVSAPQPASTLAPMKSSVSLICTALRRAVPLVKSLAVRFAKPDWFAGS